ncbi:MAG TPA: multiprotein bridging factor aMBF1 [Candidatus Nanoarchaeia archaeon]|nr:multiprotein bridging factor aMBF1 [Candidatus Nanoarchaeia archaeon]
MIQINCDLCGKVGEQLSRTLIEGVELTVCGACSKFGKVIAEVKRYSPKEQHKMIQRAQPQASKEEKIQILVEDYADLIKKRRESVGLSQKDFAMKLNEKESMIHHIETGAFEPTLEMARKLERILGIKLVEEHEEKHQMQKTKAESGFTLGDFIKIKKTQ